MAEQKAKGIRQLMPINRGGGKDMAEKNLRMKAARAERDLSQDQLAQAVGVTRQTIGMIEAGKFNPSISLCIAICKTLNRTLDQLFWEEST
jgi:putative transcriptional regulator